MRRRGAAGALAVPPVGDVRLLTRLPGMGVDFASEGLLDGLDGEARARFSRRADPARERVLRRGMAQGAETRRAIGLELAPAPGSSEAEIAQRFAERSGRARADARADAPPAPAPRGRHRGDQGRRTRARARRLVRAPGEPRDPRHRDRPARQRARHARGPRRRRRALPLVGGGTQVAARRRRAVALYRARRSEPDGWWGLRALIDGRGAVE